MKERNLSILIAAGWRERSLAVPPFLLSASPPFSSHPSVSAVSEVTSPKIT